MLNLTVEANAQLVQRAAQPPAAGFRFGGFAAHYQDYEPSLDHFAFMRTGLDYMLMHGNFDMIFWITSHIFSAPHRPSRAVRRIRLRAHAYWILIGDCNPMV